MRWVKRGFWAIVALTVFSVLHYTLPQTDIARIVGTENRRIDFGENSFFWAAPDVGTAAGSTRDVFFIQTVRPNGRVMVYRNEDTGWGWPPYFKLNSHNVQATASSLISNEASPRWVAITHYGWRNEFFTIFPNAIGLKEVAGPDVRIIPWASITILIALALLVVLFVRMFMQFRERMIDPMVDRVGDSLGAVDDTAREAKGRFWAWIDTWKGKPRK
jgi:hypothetical protein